MKENKQPEWDSWKITPANELVYHIMKADPAIYKQTQAPSIQPALAAQEAQKQYPDGITGDEAITFISRYAYPGYQHRVRSDVEWACRFITDNPDHAYSTNILNPRRHTVFYALYGDALRIPGFKPETHGDWIDLATPRDMNLKADSFTLIPLGIRMALPSNCGVLLAFRSSTPLKYGFIAPNGMTIYESKYCGPHDWWRLEVYATRDVHIPKGTRLCQFRCYQLDGDTPNPNPITLVQNQKINLDMPDRGGYGSTGTSINQFKETK